jgi:PleD family two-component response regulator
VTTYKKNEAAEDFVKRADDALYHSKETGRNKVTGF